MLKRNSSGIKRKANVLAVARKKLGRLNYLNLREKLEQMDERLAVDICKQIFSKNKDRSILQTALQFVIPLAFKKNEMAIKLLETVATENKDYTVRHNASRQFGFLVREGTPISLLTLKKMRKDPVPANREMALGVALTMARKGNHTVLPEFVYAIRTEKLIAPWETAKIGLKELAKLGNKPAQIMLQRIEEGKYPRPTKLTWNFKELGIKE